MNNSNKIIQVQKHFLILMALFFSSFQNGEKGTYPSVLIGKKITETPFAKYIKDDLPGNTLMLFISYGCSHCEEATLKAKKLEGQFDRIIILGYGDSTEKKMFYQNTKNNYKSYDYDFSSMRSEIIGADSHFPPPPTAIWILNNVINKVFVKIPAAEYFGKRKDKG
jgi:hypothetical protein